MTKAQRTLLVHLDSCETPQTWEDIYYADVLPYVPRALTQTARTLKEKGWIVWENGFVITEVGRDALIYEMLRMFGQDLDRQLDRALNGDRS